MNTEPNTSLSLLIGGEAGQGLLTVGQVLAGSFVRAGFNICVTQSYQSRIRGGHNTFAIRVGGGNPEAPAERYELILALDGETLQEHSEELSDGGWFIVDQDIGGEDAAPGVPCIAVPFKELTATRFLNTAAAGIAACLSGLDEELVGETLLDALGKKDEAVVQDNRDALGKAYAWCAEACGGHKKALPPRGPLEGRIMMQGNEAIALGAVSAGLGLYAYYPMTPSTSIAAGLIGWKQRHGNGPVIEQAEDEIAAVNMAIGASFVGVPAMVGTSGGGFALMVEGVSLAAMTETPVVIAVAQRPGPATGLPTRTEQGDLEMVLYAGHGEFPRAIFAPSSVEECFHLTRSAFELAEHSQGPVFILTDQFLADSFRAVSPIDPASFPPLAPVPAKETTVVPYRRYAISPDGVSPRLFPGDTADLVVADSDEHTEDGHITEDLGVRVRMVEKRLGKERLLRERVVAPLYEGEEAAELLLVCWGSSRGAVVEAVCVLRERGMKVAMLHFAQVWPLKAGPFLPLLEAAGRVVCVEGNATGQFARIISRETGFSIPEMIGRYDGLPFTSGYILRALKRGEPS